MKILFNGDSNMSGAEVSYEESTAYTLTQLLGATDSVNLSLTGCSNDRIYDTTIEYLKENTPDMIVIGWTEPHRIQWFDYDVGELIEMNEYEISIRPYTEKQRARAETVRDLMKLNSSYGEHQSIYWHNKIFNLHEMLRYKNIPHLFFNAFELFHPVREQYHFDWNNNYFKPYYTAYRAWGIENNKEEVTPGHFHFVGEAQIEWANILYNYIKEKNII